MKVFPPLKHADYSLIDNECGCEICIDWRVKFNALNILTPKTVGHKRNCYCQNCREMRKIRGLYLAALNRRDFYCEMSWHAGYSVSGQAMMDWAAAQLKESTDNWWYMEAPRINIGEWLERFGGQIAAEAINTFTYIVSGGHKNGHDQLSLNLSGSGMAA